MHNRIDLQAKLEELVGNKNVYFQPPASVKLSYPCVIYRVGNGNAKHANDKMYIFTHSYEVMFIYKKPNLEIIDEVLSTLPMCRLDRTYCSDNLNHYVFTIYY